MSNFTSLASGAGSLGTVGYMAAKGTALGGPWGAAIGAAAGLGMSLFGGGDSASDLAREQFQQQKKLMSQQHKNKIGVIREQARQSRKTANTFIEGTSREVNRLLKSSQQNFNQIQGTLGNFNETISSLSDTVQSQADSYKAQAASKKSQARSISQGTPLQKKQSSSARKSRASAGGSFSGSVLDRRRLLSDSSDSKNRMLGGRLNTGILKS